MRALAVVAPTVILAGCKGPTVIGTTPSAPIESEVACSGQFIATDENGIIESIGSRGLDPDGRLVDEESTTLLTDTTSRTTWLYEEDLLFEVRYDPDGDGLADDVTLYAYDSEGRVIQQIDFEREVRYQYDADGQLVRTDFMDETGALAYTHAQIWE